MKLEKLKILGLALGVAAFVACSDDSGTNASTNASSDASGKDDAALTGYPQSLDDDSQSITSGSSTTVPVIDFSSSATSQNSSSAISQDAGLPASGEYCTVTREENSVWSDMGIDGKATAKITVKKGSGRYLSIVSEYWFASSKANAYNCSVYKSQAEDWDSMTVECDANTTIVTEIDGGSLDDHEADLKEYCSEMDYDELRAVLKRFE